MVMNASAEMKQDDKRIVGSMWEGGTIDLGQTASLKR